MSTFNQQRQEVDSQFNALKQIVNFMMVVPPPTSLDEGALDAVREGAREHFYEVDGTQNTHELAKLLFDALRESLGPAQSAAYLRGMATVGHVIGPAIADYSKNYSKVLPYADIIHNTLLRMSIYLSQQDGYSLFGKEITYTYDVPSSTENSLANTSDHPQYQNLSSGSQPYLLGHTENVPRTKECVVLSLQNLSDIVRSDPGLGNLFGKDVQFLLEHQVIPRSRYIVRDSFLNGILVALRFDRLTEGVRDTEEVTHLYYQVPGFIGRAKLEDKYFISTENERVMLNPRMFSSFFYGSVLDLIVYVTRIQREAKKGRELLGVFDTVFNTE